MPDVQLVPVIPVVYHGAELTSETERLNSTLVKQVEEIVEDVEAGLEQEAAPTTHWSYTVPMPGVRYFRYL